MNKSIIAASILLMVVGGAGAALADGDQAAPPICFTFEMASDAASLALGNDPNGRLMVFSGSDAGVLLKAINDQPPQTELRADRILVMEREAKDNVQIGFIVDGCFRGPVVVTGSDWRKLKEAVAARLTS